VEVRSLVGEGHFVSVVGCYKGFELERREGDLGEVTLWKPFRHSNDCRLTLMLPRQSEGEVNLNPEVKGVFKQSPTLALVTGNRAPGAVWREQ
jgi:hypothetical protein